MNYTKALAVTIVLLTLGVIMVAFSDWQHEYYWRRERDMSYFQFGQRGKGADKSHLLERLDRTISFEEKLPNDKMFLLMSHFDKANLLGAEHRYADAVSEIALSTQLLDRFLKQFGADSPHTIAMLTRLSVNMELKKAEYLAKGARYKDALAASKRAEQIIVENYSRLQGILILPLVSKSFRLQSLIYKKMGDEELAGLLKEREASLSTYEGAQSWARQHKLILSTADGDPDGRISEALVKCKTALDSRRISDAEQAMLYVMNNSICEGATVSWQQKFCREAIYLGMISTNSTYRKRCLKACWSHVDQSQKKVVTPWQVETRDRLIRIATEEREWAILREMLVSYARLLAQTAVDQPNSLKLKDYSGAFERSIIFLLEQNEWAAHVDDLRKIDDDFRRGNVRLPICQLVYAKDFASRHQMKRASELLVSLVRMMKQQDDAFCNLVLNGAVHFSYQLRDRKEDADAERLLTEVAQNYPHPLPVSFLLCLSDIKIHLHKVSEYESLIKQVEQISADPRRPDRKDALSYMMEKYMGAHKYAEAEAIFEEQIRGLSPESLASYYETFLATHKTGPSIAYSPRESLPNKLIRRGLEVVRQHYGDNSQNYAQCCYFAAVHDYLNNDMELAYPEALKSAAIADSGAMKVPSLVLLEQIMKDKGKISAANEYAKQIDMVLPKCAPGTWFELRCLQEGTEKVKHPALYKRCTDLMEVTRSKFMEPRE